jgi:hypothetical protein
VASRTTPSVHQGRKVNEGEDSHTVQCPHCGYLLEPLDKTCPRCHKNPATPPDDPWAETVEWVVSTAHVEAPVARAALEQHNWNAQAAADSLAQSGEADTVAAPRPFGERVSSSDRRKWTRTYWGIPGWAFFVAGVMALPFVVGAVLEAVTKPLPEEAVPKPPPEEIVASGPARGLLDEYHKNEVAADLAYKGKLVLVTGTVSDISSGFLRYPSSPTVELLGMGGVYCHFEETQANLEAIAAIRKGDEVAICGRCQGYSLHVTLTYCQMMPMPQ